MATVNELMALGMPSGLANGVGQDAAATALTATGSTQADALPLASSFSIFGTVAGSTGALLPPAGGQQPFVIVNAGANPLTVYPSTGQIINNASANTGFTVTNAKTAIFIPCGTRWAANLSA